MAEKTTKQKRVASCLPITFSEMKHFQRKNISVNTIKISSLK
ncbi:hypothetical protein [Erwinia tracheiphila]|nr:hypothetical protein [Erwinia tracheiphila]